MVTQATSLRTPDPAYSFEFIKSLRQDKESRVVLFTLVFIQTLNILALVLLDWNKSRKLIGYEFASLNESKLTFVAV